MREKLFIGLVSIFAFLAPLYPIIGTLVVLILADTFTGIWKSVKKDGWKSITSTKLGRTATKLMLYNLGLIVGFLVETFLVPELPMTRVAAGFIGMVELKSLWENIGEITGIDIWGRLKVLFNKKEV